MGKRERGKNAKGLKRLIFAPAMGLAIYLALILALSILIYNGTLPEKLCTGWGAKTAYLISSSLMVLMFSYKQGRGGRKMAAVTNALLWAVVTIIGITINNEMQLSGVIFTLITCVGTTLFLPMLIPQNSKLHKRR